MKTARLWEYTTDNNFTAGISNTGDPDYWENDVVRIAVMEAVSSDLGKGRSALNIKEYFFMEGGLAHLQPER